ncbi:MAG: hypothetical protein CME70_23405 [Halobacteriovorax sp.]|nr:hypothetical protein [Halobacteriovorax sp.]
MGKKAKKITHNPFEGGEIILSVPTTESQREMWATVEMLPEATLCYNESLRVSLKGELCLRSFQRAFQEMIRRHDAMRSSFTSDGKWLLVSDKFNYLYEFMDWSETSDRSELLKKEIEKATKHKFNLVKGPPFKASLIKLDKDEHLFFITAHHIICDGWSMAIMVSELSKLYSDFLEDKRNQLSWPIQFSQYAIRENKGEITKDCDIQYWKNEFKTIPKPLDLPQDFKRPDFRTYDSKRIDLEVPPELVQKIKKLGGKLGMSYYTTLMTGFEILLHRLTKREDLVVGVSAAAQSILGEYDLCGHLVNLLPIRAKIDPNGSFESLGKELKTKMLDAFDHQTYTFGSLLKELKLKRDPSRIPLVNIIFNVDQQYFGQGLEFKKIKASYTSNPRHFENFEIFINATACGDELVLECQYNTNLFKHETILNWLEQYISIMEQACISSSVKHKDLMLNNLILPAFEESSDSEAKLVEEETPPSKEEPRVLKIWEEVLQMQGIPRDMDFFALGGHSLLANEVLTKVIAEFGVKLSLKDFFMAPTIMQFARLLDSGETEKAETKTIQGGQAPLFGEVDVSVNQLRTWYLEQFNPETTMHFLPASFRVKAKIDVLALEKSLNYLIERHSALRTCFKAVDGIPKQVIQENLNFKLELENCKEEDIVKVLNKDAELPMSLEKAPLFRSKLYKLGKEDFVFYFNVHHIIWDGWCFDIFFDELSRSYAAFAKGESPSLEKLPDITYGDFALYNKEVNESAFFKNEIKFWKENLSQIPVLELPTDFPRPPQMSNEGEALPFQIDMKLAQKLKDLAGENSSSLFNVFLTAFKMAVSLHSGSTDLVVGTPVRGRSTKELEKIIGYFVNTVSLRSRLDFQKSFAANLEVVTHGSLDAFSNQSLAFETILEHVNWERDPSRTAIYQIFFSYQDVSNREGHLGGHPYSQINIDKASTHTDLDMWIKTGKNKVEGAFEYRIDLFKKETISIIMETFKHILTLAADSAKTSLSELELIAPTQKDLLINKLNDTWIDFGSEESFHELFEQRVQKAPSSPAVHDEKGSLTYEELDNKANAWANDLISKGVVPGDLVGLSVHRHKEMLVALLAILKAGAGYVPLDPGFPQDRLDYMIESSKLKLMIVEDSLLSRFKNDSAKKLLLSEMSEENNQKPLSTYNGSSTAYVIYTSGSTGKPKGVQLPHRAVINFLRSMAVAPGMKDKDRLLAVTTLSFDIAVLELYLPLITGGSVYIATKQDAMDGESLKKIIEKEKITMMQATPSTWRLLLASGWKGSEDFKLLCGGEPFPKDLNQKLIPLVESVWNMYGPTETTVWSTIEKLTDPMAPILIGKPIANTSCYILDEEQKLLPFGRTGELYIGGHGLADGYKGREDLTLERFVPNPFRSGEKMYNTGDLARYHSDGRLECLGRNDGQVKVRGYRIELGEIESVLSQFPGIESSVVITREDQPGDVRLVGYYINSGGPLDLFKLRAFLGEKIPSYMIPSHFMELKEFPKTLNEKIDKKNLPAPVAAAVKMEEVITEEKPKANKKHQSLDSTESKLKAIWIELLGHDEIERESNFFDVGGHSLLSVQLFSKIEKEFNLSLGLATLFEASSLGGLSDLIDSKLGPSEPNRDVSTEVSSLLHSVVEIKKGQKEPIFCFHGVGGNVLNYMALVPGLDEGRGLYGMQSYGVDGNSETLNTIEEMAEVYYKEMRSVQPRGPYFLAGGSMGGYLALEVARLLQMAGEEVAELIMFDTFGPDIDLKSYGNQTHGFIENQKIMIPYRFKKYSYKLRVAFLKLFGLPIPHEIRHFFIEAKNYSALYKYEVKPFKGNITLFRSPIASTGFYSDPNLGWGSSLDGELTLIEVDGDHEKIVEALGLPKALKDYLSNSKT